MISQHDVIYDAMASGMLPTFSMVDCNCSMIPWHHNMFSWHMIEHTKSNFHDRVLDDISRPTNARRKLGIRPTWHGGVKLLNAGWVLQDQDLCILSLSFYITYTQIATRYDGMYGLNLGSHEQPELHCYDWVITDQCQKPVTNLLHQRRLAKWLHITQHHNQSQTISRWFLWKW